MNQGVEIVIARMQTNPEDFDRNGRFWSLGETLTEMCGHRNRVKRSHEPENPLFFLSDEECSALATAWKALLSQRFTNNVLADLMREQVKEYYADAVTTGIYQGTIAKNAITNNAPLTNITATQHAFEQEMKAREQALKIRRSDAMRNANPFSGPFNGTF